MKNILAPKKLTIPIILVKFLNKINHEYTNLRFIVFSLFLISNVCCILRSWLSAICLPKE